VPGTPAVCICLMIDSSLLIRSSNIASRAVGASGTLTAGGETGVDAGLVSGLTGEGDGEGSAGRGACAVAVVLPCRKQPPAISRLPTGKRHD
jgi:hypothetical protein